MAISYTINVAAADSKQSAVYAPSLPTVAADNIIIYVDLASLHRKLEIVEAWKFLYRGIRDRNLWPDVNFGPGNPIYSSVPIDSVTENQRQTANDPSILTGNVAIGVGENLREPPAKQGASDATNIHEAYFKRLIEFAREHVAFRN